MERLKKELEEWREKSRDLRTTLDGLKAKYDQLSQVGDFMFLICIRESDYLDLW